MLSTYSRVLSHPGALAFSATGLVARLPLSMLGIGIVLLIASTSGSYTVAGSVAAVYVLANSAFAVVQGRLVDAFGQSRVLPLAGTLYAIGLGGLMSTAQLDGPLALVYACAFLSGASLPQVGSCVRARWSHVLPSADQRQTAFALEAVLDEVVFVVGPVMVALLATSVHPLAGLGLALLIGLVGPSALAAQRRTEPPVHPRRHQDGSRPRLAWRVVAPLIAVMVALGVVFGSMEVATIAVAEERGATQWAGWLLALFAAGSLMAGVVTGAITWRRGPADRLALGGLGLAAAFAPIPFLQPLPLLGLWLFLCGLSVSPVLIASMSLLEQATPAGRLTEALGVLHAGLAAGVAAGAALGGAAVDGYGAAAAYGVPVVAALCTAISALVSRGRA